MISSPAPTSRTPTRNDRPGSPRRREIEARPTLGELQARRQRKVERLVDEEYRKDPQAKVSPKEIKIKKSPKKPGQIPILRRDA